MMIIIEHEPTDVCLIHSAFVYIDKFTDRTVSVEKFKNPIWHVISAIAIADRIVHLFCSINLIKSIPISFKIIFHIFTLTRKEVAVLNYTTLFD